MKTVKVIFTVLLLSAFTGIVGAQNNENNRDSRFGVKGGLNLSNLYIDHVTDEHVRESYHAGLYAKLPVLDFISVQPELLYSEKGAEVTYGADNTERSVEYSLRYIDMPVLLRVDISNFYVNAGPYGSYLLDAQTKVTSNASGTNEQEFDLNEDNFSTFDYGVAGGVGFQWKAFDLGVRYNLGLRDVGSKDQRPGANGTDPLSNGRNSVAQAYIGLGF